MSSITCISGYIIGNVRVMDFGSDSSSLLSSSPPIATETDLSIGAAREMRLEISMKRSETSNKNISSSIAAIVTDCDAMEVVETVALQFPLRLLSRIVKFTFSFSS